MPDLAPYHPIVVHFAIALLIAGAVLRWLSLTGRVPFASPAASSLLLVGMAAAFVAVKSGMAAHGPIERIPAATACSWPWFIRACPRAGAASPSRP
ncbi:MAG: hypothetical protein DMF78_25540 [Acidobacteria bacterium]|nr:MAG: hypothetical protein DMF78_25540 [Acidobacteriota bacterium]